MGRKGARDVLYRDAHREIKSGAWVPQSDKCTMMISCGIYRQQGDMAAGLLLRFVGNLEKPNVRLRELAEEK